MARVTPTEVKEIIEIDSTITDPQIEVFIISANLLTNRCEANGLTDADTLKEVERWLSAHLVAIRDTRSSSEKADVVAQSFQYKLGLNFNVTMYGQQALLMDASGTLAAIQDDAENGRSVKAGILTLGTPEDEYPTEDAPKETW